MAAVPVARRRVIASHDSLQYLAKAYRITLISANGWTNKSEASDADLARLSAQVRQERERALGLDSIADPRGRRGVAPAPLAGPGGPGDVAWVLEPGWT